MAAIKQRGRPPLSLVKRKSENLKFRTRSDVRERLEAAALASGRSLSEEVERRVEDSFLSVSLVDVIRFEIRAALTEAYQSSSDVMAATSTGS